MSRRKNSRDWNFGLIGAGTMARRHMLHMTKTGRGRVVAVSDPAPGAAAAAAKEFNVPFFSEKNEEVLNHPGVDAVIIVSPPATHCSLFLAALGAGKHILLEKPVALTVAEMRTMSAATAKRRDLTVVVASCRHSKLQPKFRYLKKIVDSGRLGEIYYVHHSVVNRQSRPGLESNTRARWFLDRKRAGGGPSFDWGVYDLAFHLGLLGDRHKLKSVSSLTRRGLDRPSYRGTFDVEEHFAAFLKFDRGLTYCWERATNAHNEVANETRIYGTKGGLKFSYFSWDPPTAILYDVSENGRGKARKTELTIPMEGHNDDNIPLLNHFMDCMEKKARPLMPLDTAVNQLKIIIKMLESGN